MPVNEGFAHWSDHLLIVTVLVYALAGLAYAAEFAFGRGARAEPAAAAEPAPVEVPEQATADDFVLVGAGVGARAPSAAGRGGSRLPVDVGVGGPPPAPPAPAGEATPADADRFGRSGRFSPGRIAIALTAIGWVCHIGSVTTRGLAAHRVPWGNMYEFSSMITLVAVTTFLVLLRRESVRWLGAFVMLPVVLYLGFAGTVLYAAPGPLVPALNSYWLKIHVVAAITSSGVFLVSGVTTVLYLFKERYERREAAAPAAATAGPSTPAQVGTTDVATGTPRRSGGIMRRIPSAAALDRTSYRVIAFAFPIWTFAIIAGAIWAEAAWSRYWGWDPKETWSFITWVAYACYLHARATAGWKGRRAAYLSLLAFSCLFIDYYLVNMVITGLHSYSGLG